MPDDPPHALRELYRATVASLPRVTRSVFLLHRMQGLTPLQIAEELDLPPEAAVSHLAQALIALDHALREAGY